MSDSGTGSVMKLVGLFDRGGVDLRVGLTADVVGPADDTAGVEAAGAAGLVPVHPAVGYAVCGFDRSAEGDTAGVDRVMWSMGEAIVRVTESVARRGMMTRLMEGIVMNVGVYGRASLVLYVVRRMVINGKSS